MNLIKQYTMTQILIMSGWLAIAAVVVLGVVTLKLYLDVRAILKKEKDKGRRLSKSSRRYPEAA